MSNALLYFYFIESVAISTAVVLSFCSGVGGCGCPISVRVCCIGKPIFALIYNESYSAAAAEVTTVWMMLVVLRMAHCVYTFMLVWTQDKYGHHSNCML